MENCHHLWGEGTVSNDVTHTHTHKNTQAVAVTLHTVLSIQTLLHVVDSDDP